MDSARHDEIREAVRRSYGKLAASGDPSCGCSPSSCCEAPSDVTAADLSRALGYTGEDVEAVPAGANMGLGCGNPQAIASLQPGETVLDLGSGGGFDCFLAAKAVGETGQVIGVDMTPEMVLKARRNAEQSGLDHVDFRLGELENLPVGDEVADVIISNCVINLSPNKERVFTEAFRVLKPGGRLAVSDVVAIAELPDEIKEDMAYHSGCVAGASAIADFESALRKAGFDSISIIPVPESAAFIRDWMPGSGMESYVSSATIEAVKPRV